MHDLNLVQRLAIALLDRRKEAQEFRTNCGIEQDWQEDEEYYQAIDAANPEGETAVSNKPVSPNGGPIGVRVRPGPARSTVFLNITRMYVDAAAARIGDMLLPNDDSNWAIKPTPLPEVPTGPAQPQVLQPGMGMAMMAEGAMNPPGQSQAAQIMQNPAQAAADGTLPPTPPALEESDADKRAKRATKVIEDWHIQCQYHAEVRKMIDDAARIGTGVLKGPVALPVTDQVFVNGTLVARQTTRPCTVRVDPWRFWYDPAAGENIQNGSYTWEYDQIGSRQLMKLLADETYIPEMIQQVLREGPSKNQSTVPERERNRANDANIGEMFPIWYFYGDITRETLKAAGVPSLELGEDLFDEEGGFKNDEDAMMAIPAVITLVNDTVVKAALNPLEGGGFPYDMMPYQRRPGLCWGKGVARQVRTPQRALNAAWRADMDNAGLTAGPMWGIRKKWMRPIDGVWEISRTKGFYMLEDAPPNAKISDALSFTNIESNIQASELRIARALKAAEDATGLPMLLQGQQGSAPDTVGGMTILNNNGSTVLRRIARNFDDYVTEPHIRRYYHWLMVHPGNDDAKGDFQIDARGSTALVERDLQNQALNNLAPLLMSLPRVNKDKLGEELIKANRLDPKRLFYTDAEYEKIRQQPPPKAPQVEVAEIRERGQNERMDKKLDFDAYVAEKGFALDEGRLKIDMEQGLAQIAKDLGVNEDNLKARMTELYAKLKTQVALSESARQANADQQPGGKPPSEPAGKAPKGESFAK